jgi:hypothetical protein
VVGRVHCYPQASAKRQTGYRLFTMNDWESAGSAWVAASRIGRPNLLLHREKQAAMGTASSTPLVIRWSRVRAPPPHVRGSHSPHAKSWGLIHLMTTETSTGKPPYSNPSYSSDLDGGVWA